MIKIKGSEIMKNKWKYIAVRWLILLAFILSVILIAFVRSRKLILLTAKSEAETIMLRAVDSATVEVLNSEDFSYDKLAVVSKDQEGTILGIEINSSKADILKSKLAQKITEILNEKSRFTVSIPFGNFFNNEYLTGFGPDLKFKIQMANTASLNFKSAFEESGINNTLHQIIITVDIPANIIITGGSDTFSVKTNVLAAQTVIVGQTPDSFTNVTENPGDDIADDIFNFADLD